MAGRDTPGTTDNADRALSRRTFIKSAIAGGGCVSAASHLFRHSTPILGQSGLSGGSERLMTLRGLRQDPDGDDAWRGVFTKELTCLTSS